jgi:hypothetical protein
MNMKTRYYKPPEDLHDTYLPIRSAAGVARLNLETVYSAIRDGRLHAILVAPGTVRVRLSDLNKFLATQNGGSKHEHVN